MAFYKYTAVTEKGETVEGTYTATSKAILLQWIREKKQHPIKIIEVVEKKDLLKFNLYLPVGMKDMAVFCRQFYTMLNSGVTVIKCLDILQQQTENKRLKQAIRDVYESVQMGSTLSESLKKHKDVFPDLFFNMVESGEIGGSLDTVMERMSVHFEKENKIRSKVRGAMVYPIVLSVVALSAVIFLLTFVMPTFLAMFEGSDMPLPLPTRMLIALSNVLLQYWYIVLGGILVLSYALRKFIKSDKGGMFWDRLKLRIPIIRGTVKKLAVSRFTRTLSTLLASGIPLLQALEVVAKVVGNRAVGEGIMNSREDMRRGLDLAGTIRRMGIFPPMVDSMIHVGEESGTLDDILDKTADFYDDEVEVALQKLVSLLEPLMIVFMAVIIGFIVISMAFPMFDMLKTVR